MTDQSTDERLSQRFLNWILEKLGLGEVLAAENGADALAKLSEQVTHQDLAILDNSIPATEYFELESVSHAIATDDSMTAVGYPGWAPGDMLNIRPRVVSTLTVKSTVGLIEVTQKLT